MTAPNPPNEFFIILQNALDSEPLPLIDTNFSNINDFLADSNTGVRFYNLGSAKNPPHIQLDLTKMQFIKDSTFIAFLYLFGRKLLDQFEVNIYLRQAGSRWGFREVGPETQIAKVPEEILQYWEQENTRRKRT